MQLFNYQDYKKKSEKDNKEEIKNVKRELNDKFNYLDKKIDNIQNSLVKEISEEIKNVRKEVLSSRKNFN